MVGPTIEIGEEPQVEAAHLVSFVLLTPSQTSIRNARIYEEITQKNPETGIKGNQYHVSYANICKHLHTPTNLDVCEYYIYIKQNQTKLFMNSQY
mgnify:CR=1 FL=1